MLTPDAKKLLAETIRGTAQDPEKGIRGRLLRAIHDEADRQYRLSVPIDEAKLDEMHAARRKRIEAWLGEGARATKPKSKNELKATKERLQAQAEKEAAATLVNRLVLLRHLEALGLSKPAVVTGGWSSKGYREFREFAPTLCTNGTTDATEGYSTLLQLLFDELAVDLPGLFGDVGLTKLFPIPAATLRDVIERLDDPGLLSAWTDDTTLGWVYQYWNDPDREALDDKINDGGKIQPHEIASKTQMFTERYMVEWLLQNSLGLTWLAMCQKRKWTADAARILPVLDARRADWRAKREAGEVALDVPMPIEGELEEHWKYYVPQPIPQDAIDTAPESVNAIKILDPACGSGHFLVIAFGLLAALYREEARHLGTKTTDKDIAESILENNLYGVDIDPRAIQIAAAGLHLKARTLAKSARPKTLNLVAPVFQLGNLPTDDPAIVLLRKELKDQAGVPAATTTRLLTSLAGVDYLGSLLKVDAVVEGAILRNELDFDHTPGQDNQSPRRPAQRLSLSVGEAKTAILYKLEQFLAKHSKSEDLGLRLDGEQLASGVRFVRIAKEGMYDLVVGNPPYLDLSKRAEALDYLGAEYSAGKANLYSCFMARTQQLANARRGLVALVTMRGWMFQKQFQVLREQLLDGGHLRCLADLGTGAFSEIGGVVVSAALGLFGAPAWKVDSLISVDVLASDAKQAALAIVAPTTCAIDLLQALPGSPLVHWWDDAQLQEYIDTPKLGDVAPVRTGLCTSNNVRFIRFWWELAAKTRAWAPLVSGAKSMAWIDPCDLRVRWSEHGLEMKVFNEGLYGSYSRTIQNEVFYFRPGIAYTTMGHTFAARAHRIPSIIEKKGSSVFPSQSVGRVVCAMNASKARDVVQSLNPGTDFQVGDVNRLPLFEVHDADAIFARVECSFAEHEATREASSEFKRPGPSPWCFVQGWAQAAVDRQKIAALPEYAPTYDGPARFDLIAFAIGVAMGRFGANGEGVLAQSPSGAVPSGTIFISAEAGDSIDRASSAALLEAWKEHGGSIGEGDDLRTYLRKSFFDSHKKVYENRPIYFPLSSSKKNFVAFISIHRWADDTLNVLLADHVIPAKRRLDGELEELRTARAAGNNKGKAEKRFTDVQKLLEELNDFIAKVTEVAEQGPPPSDEKTGKRAANARFTMDLDDGLMVNSAALWPLLEPQWKDPKKWWKELANAAGKKDYDWSHLAARYFPERVRAKCHTDPSLAVAHKCFWELHPTKAYAWELRLQDEIRPDFTIDEPGSNEARKAFLADHAREAHDIRTKELKRREKKGAKADDEGDGPLFNQEADEPEESDD